MLNFSKDSLDDKDKSHLDNKTNFEILLSVIREKNAAIQKSTMSALMVLSLLFPSYDIRLLEDRFGLFQEDNEISSLNKDNFEIFKEIMNEMFCLKEVEGHGQDYNPGGSLAAAIVEKLKKAREKKSQTSDSRNKPVSILNRYVSILAVGEQKDMNLLLGLTVYQLFDEFHRYEKKVAYDIWLQAKMAGAKDLKDVDNWMDDVHEDSSI